MMSTKYASLLTEDFVQFVANTKDNKYKSLLTKDYSYK